MTVQEKLIKLQEKIDVRQFSYKGSLLWPIIKISAGLSVKSKTAGESFLFAVRSLQIIKGIRAFFTLILLSKIPRADVLFLSSEHYKTKEGERLTDKFITPYEDICDDNGIKYLNIEYSHSNSNSQKRKGIDVQNLMIFCTLLWKIQFKFFNNQSFHGDFLHLNQLLKEHHFNFKADQNFLWKVFLIDKQSGVFNRILKKAEIKKSVVVCFYDSKSLAFVKACNELNIPVMDIQHGLQGKQHVAYSNWDGYLTKTSAFFPSHFHVWTEEDKTNLQENFPAKTILNLGNPWIQNRLNFTDKDLILFSHQPIENSFPLFLMETIKNYEGNLKWYIRMHPRNLKDLSRFQQEFRNFGIIEKVNFEDATFTPLTDLLARTKIHITQFSSVALEASMFNIPTIILHEKGLEYFKGAIPERFLHAAQSKRNLTDLIQHFESSPSNIPSTENAYFSGTPDKMEDFLF